VFLHKSKRWEGLQQDCWQEKEVRRTGTRDEVESESSFTSKAKSKGGRKSDRPADQAFMKKKRPRKKKEEEKAAKRSP